MKVAAAIVALLGAFTAVGPSAAQDRPSAADVEAWRVEDCRAIGAVVASLRPLELQRRQTLGPKETAQDPTRPPLHSLLGPQLVRGRDDVRCLEVAKPEQVSANASFELPKWSADYGRVVVVLHLESGWRGYLLVRDRGDWRIEESRPLVYTVEPTEVWEIV